MINYWKALDIKLKKCPSMLTDEEKKYLYWLGKNSYNGLGEVVEVGCWLGSSTTHLLMGLKENENFRKQKIHVFDNFIWNTFSDLELRRKCEEDPELRTIIRETGYFEKPIKPDESFEPLFRSICADDLGYMQVKCAELQEFPNSIHSGRLLKWDSVNKVEILFIDAAKTWYALNYLFAEFSGSLMPGESLIISQDYKVPYSYWHILFFEFFSEYFKIEHAVSGGGTVTFRLEKEFPFPRKLVFPDSEDEMTFYEMSEIFERVIKKWRDAGDDLTAVHLYLPYAVMCHKKKQHKKAMEQIAIAWSCWSNKKTIELCASRYLNEPDLTKWGLYK